MLETPGERVELLKAGISGKKMEELHILYNNFKIVHSPVFREHSEIYTCGSKGTGTRQESIAELCL